MWARVLEIMEKIMEKPMQYTISFLDYNEVYKYIGEKYGKNLNDWAGRENPENRDLPEDQKPPLQNFWSSIFNFIHNGCYLNLWRGNSADLNDWEQEIYDILFEEFSEFVDEDSILFYVDW